MLNAANAPLAAMQRVLDAGRVVLAADTLGAAQHMFDQALAFVKQRSQFNRVIGSFQAVKHQFADMVTMLEPCRAMVWYAAYAQDALPDEARLTALQTKAHLGDVGRDIARMATEAHGGMGFTDLLGLHYWFKRISFNRQMLGSAGTLPRRSRAPARMDLMQTFINSSALISDGLALAARMQRDGYLFLPGLLPREDVAAVQRQIGEIARDAGWLRRDVPMQDAIADLAGFCVDPDPTYLKTLRRINRLEDYHALKHHPVLIDLLERMLGGPILPHPRVLMRNIFPARDEYTTKAHQDFPNVQGTTEVYTAWMPLIDCPMEVGPLQIAIGSHTNGVYDFGIAGGAGGIEIKDPLEGTWASGAFAVGDVLLFHSMAVHKGVPNHSNKLRMSMDVRYQLVSEPFNIDNANPDGQPLSWDEVYARLAIRRTEILLATPATDAEAIRPKLVRKARRARFRIRRSRRPACPLRAATHRGARCRRGEASPRATAARRAAVTAFDVRHYDSIGSTNDEAVRLAQEGAPHGTVVHADEQTVGRGRLSRRWSSPPGNLYLSIILRLDLPAARNVEIGFIAALAVADAIETMLPRQERATLKWPNDVLVRDGKISGILAEQADDALILGIGVNVLEAPGGVSYNVSTIVGCGRPGDSRRHARRAADRTGKLARRLAAGRLRGHP